MKESKKELMDRLVEEDIAQKWADYRENPSPDMSFDAYLQWELLKTKIKNDEIWDLNLMIS